jgi:hypothetical protein
LLVLSRNAVISRGFNKADFPTYVFLANAIPTIIASPSGQFGYDNNRKYRDIGIFIGFIAFNFTAVIVGTYVTRYLRLLS